MRPSLKSYAVFTFAWTALACPPPESHQLAGQCIFYENTALLHGGWPHSQNLLRMFPDKTALARGGSSRAVDFLSDKIARSRDGAFRCRAAPLVPTSWRECLPTAIDEAVGNSCFYPREALIFVAGGAKCAPVNPGATCTES
ncbi:hypothetical protein BDN71DRAFT_1593826, partial [Pleurotus eryngii]